MLSIHFLIITQVFHQKIKKDLTIVFQIKGSNTETVIFYDLLTGYVTICVHSCSNAVFDGNPDHAAELSSSNFKVIRLNRQVNCFQAIHEYRRSTK